MTDLLQLMDWMTSSEALRYIEKLGLNTNLRDLLKTYRLGKYELKLDHKDPDVFYIGDDDDLIDFPEKIFGAQWDFTHYVHELGKIIHLAGPELIYFDGRENGPAENEAIIVKRTYDTLSFHSARDLNRVYIQLQNKKNQNKHNFGLLSWRVVLDHYPNLLLFQKAYLEEMCQSLIALNSFQNTKSKTSNAANSFTSKEKNTLLVLIAALCKEAKVDYRARGISTALQAMTEALGAPVTDDTIRTILRQIDDAVESRSK